MLDDIHPEELLVTKRVLSDEEQADLRAHLARCPGCAMQATLRGDVAPALVPTDIDYEIGARAVAQVLASQSRATPPARVLRSRAPARAPLATRAAVVLLVVLGSAVAASALVLSSRGRLWGTTPAAVAPEGAPRRTPDRAPAPRGASPRVEGDSLAPPVAPAAEVAAAPVITTTPVAPVVPSPLATRFLHTRALAERAPAVGAHLTERRLAAPEPSSPPAEPAPPVSAEPQPVVEAVAEAAPQESASVLFKAAARARREGDPAGAERLFGRLAAEFPGAREEVIARVLRGQTLLDNLGHPLEALASFEHYLRDQPNGALAEGARAGRAQALWLLGRAAEEAAAWRELLTAHPRSLHATLARSRLAALAKAE